jgi:hypothetical protein
VAPPKKKKQVYYSMSVSEANYLVTPSSRILLQKSIAAYLVKKLLGFYGNERFIIAFTTA